MLEASDWTDLQWFEGNALRRATGAPPLTSNLVNIPAPNTEDDDKNPPRIAHRNLFDLSVEKTISSKAMLDVSAFG